jgi:diguanylate cyclase (GGDEF)-like protein/PAS domain S-box-containing protein
MAGKRWADADVAEVVRDRTIPTGDASDVPHDTNWLLLELDSGGVVRSVTGQAAGMLGYEPADLIGQFATAFIHPAAIGEAVITFLTCQEKPGAFTTQGRWVRRDGTDLALETSFLNPGETVDGGMLVILHDIADRVRDEQELEDSQRELEELDDELGELAEDLALLAEEVPFPVFRGDVHGTVRFHNARWTDVVPPTVTDLHQLIESESVAELDAALASAHAGTDTVIEVRAAGDRIWRLHLQRITGTGEDGLVGTIEDITATVELRQRAEHDALTGLAGRALAELRLAHAVTDDPAGTVVVYVDLDGFKGVNDTYGHAAGDTVLRAVGQRLAAAVRPADLVSRLGGDEFVVVCRDVNPGPAATEAIVDHLRRVLAGPVTLGEASWEPRASFGTARPGAGEAPDAVLRRADQEMLAEKRLRGVAR